MFTLNSLFETNQNSIKMKIIICLAALIAIALAAPAEDPASASVLRYDNDPNTGEGAYNYG